MLCVFQVPKACAVWPLCILEAIEVRLEVALLEVVNGVRCVLGSCSVCASVFWRPRRMCCVLRVYEGV